MPAKVEIRGNMLGQRALASPNNLGRSQRSEHW